jgi:hypothetical protein
MNFPNGSNVIPLALASMDFIGATEYLMIIRFTLFIDRPYYDL